VLVVEDSPDDLELFATYLAANGFIVTTLESGANAFSEAVATAPDAILLDLVLGRDDGLAIVQALRAEPRTAALPIVAITAAVPRYLPEVAMTVGCSDFLTKPCLPDDVAKALRGAIARRSRPQA
jgi:CheY-like chemotaxis protein